MNLKKISYGRVFEKTWNGKAQKYEEQITYKLRRV